MQKVSREREVVILGRGFAYPNAREAALKVQETCKISVQGLSTADYLHGPISALTADTQVFIVAPAHMPTSSITEATTKIRKTSSRIFWIGSIEVGMRADLLSYNSSSGAIKVIS